MTSSTPTASNNDGASGNISEVNNNDEASSNITEVNNNDGASGNITEVNNNDGASGNISEVNNNDGASGNISEVNNNDGVSGNISEVNNKNGASGNIPADDTNAIPPNIDGGPDNAPVVYPYSWANVIDKSECQHAFAEMQDQANSPLVDIDSYLRYVRTNLIQDKFQSYHQSIETIFTNVTFNLSLVESHKKCLDLEMNLTEMDNVFIAITELGANLARATTYHEAYQYAVQIPALYKKRIQYDPTQFDDIYNNAKTICNWLRKYGQETSNEVNKYAIDFETVNDENDAAVRQLELITKSFNKLNDEVINKIEPTVKHGAEYFNKTITKVKLTKKFHTPFFTKAVLDLADTSANMVDITKDYSDDIKKGKDKLFTLYNKLFKLKLPILNSYNVYQLELVRAAELINETVMQDLVHNLKTEMDVQLPELVAETYDRLINPTEEITDSVDDLIARIDTLSENLKEYEASTKMNTEFFM